jgi:hypothetical protein
MDSDEERVEDSTDEAVVEAVPVVDIEPVVDEPLDALELDVALPELVA